jgi:hypothetical protein
MSSKIGWYILDYVDVDFNACLHAKQCIILRPSSLPRPIPKYLVVYYSQRVRSAILATCQDLTV